MVLIVATWFWGDKYPGFYVDRLVAGVRRHLVQPFRFMVFSPREEDQWLRRGCLCRMRLFDPQFQSWHGIEQEQRVAVLDLDTIITGPLDQLFDRPESLTILSGANAANPCPFNGSVMMMRGGTNRDLWADINQENLDKTPRYDFVDDQGWIYFRRPNAATWTVGPSSGIYAFQKPGWPRGDSLPADARLVCFPGWRDPAKFAHLPWIAAHWS